MLFKSLKTRLILAFSLFGVLLTLFYWLLLMGFLLYSEDIIFDHQLNNEMQRQIKFYEQNQHFDALPPDMALYTSSEVVNLPIYSELIDMEDGLSELEDEDLHIAKATLTTTDSDPITFYIIFYTVNQEIDDAGFERLYWIGLIVFAIVALTGIVFGAYMGNRTATPIARLDKRVQSLDKDDNFGETDSFGEDEVGRLAHSFATAYDRSQQFLIREKRFTREVSHELRTPTAVIRGALDILELQPKNTDALGRINRACRQIQQLIDTFLLLGREENLTLSQHTTDTDGICRTVVEQYRKTSRVPLHYHQVGEPELNLLPPVFAVLLSNLIDNAVRHTFSGSVEIRLEKHQLSVTDTGSGFPPEMLTKVGKPYLEGSTGQGLGLSIVYRICEQFGWQLVIESEPNQGSQIHIVFHDSSK